MIRFSEMETVIAAAQNVSQALEKPNLLMLTLVVWKRFEKLGNCFDQMPNCVHVKIAP